MLHQSLIDLFKFWTNLGLGTIVGAALILMAGNKPVMLMVMVIMFSVSMLFWLSLSLVKR